MPEQSSGDPLSIPGGVPTEQKFAKKEEQQLDTQRESGVRDMSGPGARNAGWYKALGILAVACVLALSAGGVHQVAARSQRSMVNVKLVLKWVPQAQFGGYFVALDKGFYRQQGLNVTIIPGGTDVVPEQVVASGGANFGVDWLSALLKARDQGLPLVNIAQIYQASGMRLITFKSSGITSIAGFRHKRIGVWFAGNQYQFEALMAKEHMSPPSRYMTVVSQPFVMTPFLNHQIDVAHAMTYNELGVVLEAGIKMSQLRVFDYNKLGVTVLEDGLMANGSWARAHRAIVVKFLRASIEGWKWAVQHPAQAGQISYNHAPAATRTQGTLHHQMYMARQVAKLIMSGPGMHHPIGYMDPAAYHRSWSILLQEGVIKHAPSNAYDQSYWQAASKGM